MASSYCTVCPDGYFSYAGSEYCTPTPPGYYAKNSTLLPCGETMYSDWGYTECKVCEDGYLCPRGGEIGKHYGCPKGSYCQAGIQTKCKDGYFGLIERARTEDEGCGICPAGYYCIAGTDNFELHPCPRGYYCPVQTGLPIECAKGFYNDQLFGKTLGDC